jgi:hypothetical protein
MTKFMIMRNDHPDWEYVNMHEATCHEVNKTGRTGHTHWTDGGETFAECMTAAVTQLIFHGYHKINYGCPCLRQHRMALMAEELTKRS